MAATLVDLSGFTFGIASDEGTMNVESISFRTQSKVIDVPDKAGETRGSSYYDLYEEVTISGETTDAPAATIGTALTVANSLNLGGVSAGDFITNTVQVDLGREALRKITITARRFPNVTAA